MFMILPIVKVYKQLYGMLLFSTHHVDRLWWVQGQTAASDCRAEQNATISFCKLCVFLRFCMILLSLEIILKLESNLFQMKSDFAAEIWYFKYESLIWYAK